MPGGTHMNLGLSSEVKTREAFQSSHFVLVFRSRFEPSPGTSTALIPKAVLAKMIPVAEYHPNPVHLWRPQSNNSFPP